MTASKELSGWSDSYYEKYRHYWTYVSDKLGDLKSVKFIKFSEKHQDISDDHKGLEWIRVAIYEIDDLEEAFNQMIGETGDDSYKLLYSVDSWLSS